MLAQPCSLEGSTPPKPIIRLEPARERILKTLELALGEVELEGLWGPSPLLDHQPWGPFCLREVPENPSTAQVTGNTKASVTFPFPTL